MNTQTQQKHYEFKPTPEMTAAALDVFKAMALVELTKPVVIEYKTKILKEINAVDATNGKPITEPEYYWLMSDEQQEIYYTRSYEEARKAGYDIKMGSCPLMVAEHLLLKAHINLVREVRPVISKLFNCDMSWERLSRNHERLHRYIDRILQILAPTIKFQAA
jgi:hypothetical protein